MSKYKTYTYRHFPFHETEERLNEAVDRGWRLHTFCDGDGENHASAVFSCDDPDRTQLTPFADDDDDDEEEEHGD
jgi:hypothetical protein